MDGFGTSKRKALDALSDRIDYYGGELLERNFRSTDRHSGMSYYLREIDGHVCTVQLSRKNHVTRARLDGT